MTSTFERVLVTGGAGFVGTALITEIGSRLPDASLAVLDSEAGSRLARLPDSASIWCADLRDGRALEDVVARVRPDLVFHLAALQFIPYCIENPRECLDVNVLGTQTLLDALSVHAPRRLVIASSAAVYGPSERPHREDEVPNPADIYGTSKWTNERQLALFARTTGVPCTAARFFNVYGPAETKPLVIPEIFAQVRAGKDRIELGNTAPRRDWVHSADVARALCLMAEANVQGFEAFNVGTGTARSVLEIVETLAAVTGRPLQVESVAERQRPSDRPHMEADMAKSRRMLGFSTRLELRDGLADLWCRYQEEAAAGSDSESAAPS